MYGDCQVMPTMGGNVVSSETLFSSPSIQNPNFNFIPFQPFPPMIAVSTFFSNYIYYLLCIPLLQSIVMSLVQIFLFRKKKTGCWEERMRWRVGLGVNRLKKSQGMSKRLNNLPRRNATTGTPLARSKKWKRTINSSLLWRNKRLLEFKSLSLIIKL